MKTRTLNEDAINLEIEDRVVRLHTRMRRKKRARVIWARVIATLMFMLLFSCIFLLNSEIFQIKDIRVNGNQRVSQDEAIKLSGIQDGENMLSFRAGRVEAAVAKHPLVTYVKVSRRLPSKIIVSIRERRPYAYVKSGKTYYLIDAEKVVLERDNVARYRSLKLLHTSVVEPVDVGRKLDFPYDEKLHDFFEVAKKSMNEIYSDVHFRSSGITVDLNNGAYVLLGSGDKLKRKLELLPLLVKSLDGAGQHYAGINLRNMETPTFIQGEPGDKQDRADADAGEKAVHE